MSSRVVPLVVTLVLGVGVGCAGSASETPPPLAPDLEALRIASATPQSSAPRPAPVELPDPEEGRMPPPTLGPARRGSPTTEPGEE
jgi:hypothetical protein